MFEFMYYCFRLYLSFRLFYFWSIFFYFLYLIDRHWSKIALLQM